MRWSGLLRRAEAAGGTVTIKVCVTSVVTWSRPFWATGRVAIQPMAGKLSDVFLPNEMSCSSGVPSSCEASLMATCSAN
jgi:hypothetical protein